MPKKKKQITTEDLALMIANGFEETATKQDFSRLEKRVGGLEGRVGGLEKDMKGLKQDVGGLKQDVGGLKQDLEYLSERVARIEAKLDRALYQEIARLEDLIKQLARKTKVTLEY